MRPTVERSSTAIMTTAERTFLSVVNFLHVALGLIVSLLHLLQPFDPDRYSVVVRYVQLLHTFKPTTVGLRDETFHCI